MSSPLKVEIAVRAFTEQPSDEAVDDLSNAARERRPNRNLEASPWILVFDCETTTDAAQNLRFGFYGALHDGDLQEEGMFFNSSALETRELKLVRAYAKARKLRLITVEKFRLSVFLHYGYDLGGTIVGFNLPWDISRIAIAHAPARLDMRGGFTFHVTRNDGDPRVRIKHLNRRAALISFSLGDDQDRGRGMRRRQIYIPGYRGHFVDVSTLATALTSRRFTLASLARELGTTEKIETSEHGVITEAYLDYGRNDVKVTWECFAELSRRYAAYGLSKPIDKILSEASIGKACLEQMGIQPLLTVAPNFPRKVFGEILCAYYGGRTEVRNRRVICEVRYVDFKSMYPTVNALMGLWEFVIADGMTWVDTTEQTREFIDTVTLDDLLRPETWRHLRTLVQITPDDDLLPVRADYVKACHPESVTTSSYTIGLNYLTASTPLWYTLADCIVAKLLSGRTPRIDSARTFYPGPPQQGLEPIQILGREDYTIDPRTDDLFRRLIDLRDEAKARGDDSEQVLKTIANATSYGIFIEVNRDDARRLEPLDVYGPGGTRHETESPALEDPGRYFNPLLAVLITGAARLMLGIAEKLVVDRGLDWAFCDTDSLAIVRTEGISRKEFRRQVDDIIRAFETLNPYCKQESILKLEKINSSSDPSVSDVLYCYPISAKRYALFNVDRDGNPVLRKPSAHGLGHLVSPYGDDNDE